MTRLTIIFALTTLISGCTVAQSVNYGVSRYCLLPPEVRAANREAVALAVTPNRIRIDCYGL